MSAPSFAFSAPAEDGFSTTRAKGSGVVDAMWEEESIEPSVDEFLVASVKQKVVQRREKELERSVSAEAGLESWDDDFLVEGEESNSRHTMSGLQVPLFLKSVQEAVRSEGESLRKFALHIEDLKLIYMDAMDISFGLEFEAPERVEPLAATYQTTLDVAQVLIHLGDFNDHDEKLKANDMHLRILGELLGEELKSIDIARMKMQFGCEYVQILVEKIGPLKKKLIEYVGELRKVSRELL
ncbi:hypothetical protein BCR33DRAFT_779830 [Rhizoclosmatium globosum]|uniref:Uncharacterized protein n=1 Tax=Rhizoclosmatium globosum TaxID=329046 RepID=A0A1Y2D096_9FUNG|nr:hypothetical protein BCR33DRAFT_779830 [Rhizoclosmatium globosum]|eukprot:ORY52556.1 hypothetical protein BCR33DRAFT_779830 [Rhizoclosmatium globosum]